MHSLAANNRVIEPFFPGHVIVGFAMYYFTYDPWIGKLLYLEDFYVMKEYRGMNVTVCICEIKWSDRFMRCNTLFLLLKLGFGIGSEILKKLSEVIEHLKINRIYFCELFLCVARAHSYPCETEVRLIVHL